MLKEQDEIDYFTIISGQEGIEQIYKPMTKAYISKWKMNLVKKFQACS